VSIKFGDNKVKNSHKIHIYELVFLLYSVGAFGTNPWHWKIREL
jgi:hypothetical protein